MKVNVKVAIAKKFLDIALPENAKYLSESIAHTIVTEGFGWSSMFVLAKSYLPKLGLGLSKFGEEIITDFEESQKQDHRSTILVKYQDGDLVIFLLESNKEGITNKLSTTSIKLIIQGIINAVQLSDNLEGFKKITKDAVKNFFQPTSSTD